jgi:hypothetical protein
MCSIGYLYRTDGTDASASIRNFFFYCQPATATRFHFKKKTFIICFINNRQVFLLLQLPDVFFSFKTEIAAVVIQQIRMRNANKFMAMKSVKIFDSPENQSARVQQFYIKKFFLSYIKHPVFYLLHNGNQH